MSTSDITVEILRSIRDEIRGVRIELKEEIQAVRTELKEEIQAVRTELKETNQRLDRLEQRQNATELRLATELVAVTGAIKDVHALLADRLDLRKDVDDLRVRVMALEERAAH